VSRFEFYSKHTHSPSDAAPIVKGYFVVASESMYINDLLIDN